MKKTMIIISICLFTTSSFFSGCINIPEELTQFSIMAFDVEPSIINQGEYANLSWVVLSATTVTIDNEIGNVALTGHRMIQPTQSTTYTLTANNETMTKNASVTIIVKPIMFLKDEDKLVGKWNSEEIWSSEAVWSNLPTIFEFFPNGTFQIKITLGTINFSFTDGQWNMNDGILTTEMEDVIPLTDLTYKFSEDGKILTLTDTVSNEFYILRKQ